MSNWRITDGNIYISKAGNDSRAGTQLEPRRSLSGITAVAKAVIGAGDYAASLMGDATLVEGDGNVVIRGTALNNIGLARSGRNLTIVNCLIPDVPVVATGAFSLQFAVVKNSVGYGTSSSLQSRSTINSVFIDSQIGNRINQQGAMRIQSSVFIDSVVHVRSSGFTGATPFFVDSFLDFDSVVIYTHLPTAFRNNNIRGLVQLPVSSGWAFYAIQDQLIGTPQDNGYGIGVKWLTEANLIADGYIGTVSGWNTAVATCINRDPLFNDIGGEDFTLQAGSPHIRRAQNGIDNIGGTRVARSVINTDHNGVTVFVEPSAQIDTSIPNSYTLLPGQTEGFIDYIFDLGQVAPLGVINIKAELKFDTDFAGGTIQNENVPDAEPLTAQYAGRVNTAAAGGNTSQLIVPTGLITVGRVVRVLGQRRTVTVVTPGTPNDTITVDAAFSAIIASGVTVTYGTAAQIAALNPNRLTYQLRVSTQATKPAVNSEWDNDLDPALLQAGTFFQQEWGLQPIYAINAGQVWGGGDSARPVGATTQQINARWLNVRVYLRDNYSSNGL